MFDFVVAVGLWKFLQQAVIYFGGKWARVMAGYVCSVDPNADKGEKNWGLNKKRAFIMAVHKVQRQTSTEQRKTED